MNQSIKIDLNGPKVLTISYKAVKNGFPISAFPLTFVTRNIKIGNNSFLELKVDSDSLPLCMNPIGSGSGFEILDSDRHLLYAWALQDDKCSSQGKTADRK